jgi:PAS domain S-box-containing protein
VLAVPLIKDGAFLAMLYIHHHAPRRWTAADARLVEEVAERTWAAVERARADLALRVSEDHYRNTVELNPQVTWTARPDGQLDNVSQRWMEWTGTTGLGDTWADGLHPEDRARTFEAWAASVATGRPYDIEHRVHRLTGEYRWARSRAYPRLEGPGRIVKWYGTTEDIHKRKLAEAELTRVNQELAEQAAARTRERNRLWEMSRDLFAIMGFDGYLKLVNPAWTRVLGYDEATLLASHFSALVHPEDHASIGNLVATLADGRAVEGFEDRILHADGRYRWISWTAVPEGEVFYAVGRDVTAEKEREEHRRQAQKIEALGALTGGVAHDFNNLLMAISGGLDMLDRHRDPERSRRVLDGMRQAVERGTALSRQLLTFSRRQPLKAEAIDVARLVEGMRELLDRSLRGDIAVETRLPADLWPAEADPGELELALLNLAVNARDAMPDGGMLTVSAANRPGGAGAPDQVEIAVADTGAGMSAEVLARAFDPYFTTKEVGKGSGLGLPQVHGFVTSSGGSVEIASRPGHGTTVTLRLPRSSRTTAEAAPVPERAVARASVRASGRVLVVEDDQDVAALTVQMVAEIGFQALHVADAGSALAALAGGEPVDVVFTDIMMPGGMNGVELSRAIRARHPDLPVVLTSGYAAAAILGENADGLVVLRKPYRLKDLQDALTSVLDVR